MAINSDKYSRIKSAFFGVVSRSVASAPDPDPAPEPEPVPPIGGVNTWISLNTWS